MSPTDDLIPILKKLRLSGVLNSLELRTRQAVEDALSHPEFLYRLLVDEVERRDQKQLDLRLRRAAFEAHKTVEDFDFAFNPAVPKSKVIDLATCGFVSRNEVVLLTGQAGVGKSHIAQAIGHRACLLGHSVLYTSATQMLGALRAARADQSYDRRLLRYATPDLLIVDDIGLRPLRDFEPEDVYEIIRQRYERGATIWTSNRSAEEMYALFGDELLASAAMDRLLHYATTIEIEGESYRNPRARRASCTRSGDPRLTA
jgi:DNA replication protein DnaC